MNVPTREVGHPGIYSLVDEDLKKMPCQPIDITLSHIDGALSGSGAVDVVFKLVLRARMHGVWVGIEQGCFLTNERFDDTKAKTFKEAFHEMLETGLLEIPGLKTGFLSFTNIFKRHIVCPSEILIKQLQRHELLMS